MQLKTINWAGYRSTATERLVVPKIARERERVYSRWPAVILATGLLSATAAGARDYGQFGNVDPATRQWVQGLRDKLGKGCCDTADGHPAEYEWDIAGKSYRVRIEGEWHTVPPEAVIDEPNRLGYATVWYWWSWDLDGRKSHHIRCFLPGAGG
jgi:hypothetical protein